MNISDKHWRRNDMPETIFSSKNKDEINRIASESKFETLFHNSSDEIYLIDTTGNFIEVNQTMCNRLGYSQEELLNMNVNDIKPPKFADATTSLLEKVREENSVVFESEHVSKTGIVIPVETKSRLIQYGSKQAVLSIARDITERKQTERKIVNAIIETEEKEKARFAKDLHDSLGTLLSSINIYLSVIKENKINNVERERLLNVTKSLVDEAVASAKEIANNLRPDVISRFGLVAAVKSLCEKINNTGVIEILFDSGNLKNAEMSKDVEVSIYRIINELINNTLKHAFADKIIINFSIENELLILSFSDNGIGFNVQNVLDRKASEGMGLMNIISRVEAINGNYKIESNCESGTKVLLNISLV